MAKLSLTSHKKNVVGSILALLLSVLLAVAVDGALHQHRVQFALPRKVTTITATTQRSVKKNPSSSIPSWFKDVCDDFAATSGAGYDSASSSSSSTQSSSEPKKESLLHECVVNYGWGLVGNF